MIALQDLGRDQKSRQDLEAHAAFVFGNEAAHAGTTYSRDFSFCGVCSGLIHAQY